MDCEHLDLTFYHTRFGHEPRHVCNGCGTTIVFVDDDDYWEHVNQREAAITKRLEEIIGEYLRELFGRQVDFELETFDSDNGEDHWHAPFAGNLVVDALGVDEDEPAYGLCDAAVGTVDDQARFMFEQMREGMVPVP